MGQSVKDISSLREVIKSARFQFSPATQTTKQAAVDRIVEQCIGLAKAPGVAPEEILQGSRIGTDGVTILKKQDVVEAVIRLAEARRIATTEGPDGPRYSLTRKTQREFENLGRECEKRAARVVTRLFANRARDPQQLVVPFFDLLGRVFSKLSETYIRVLKHDVPTERFLQAGEVAEAVAAVESMYAIDRSVGLGRAAMDFFQSQDPDAVAIKWNIAQSYYISLALGLDPAGDLLTKELFGASTLFLDTNVVIHGVEPTAHHHKTFHTLVQACANLDIRLSVWIETLRELDRVVTFQVEQVLRVAPHIPRETAPKVRGIFFQLYREALKRSGMLDADGVRALFANFVDARRILEDEYSVDLAWDEPLESDSQDPTVVATVERMMEYYRERRRRPKGRLSALHDVLLLRKMGSECAAGARSMVVTLDTFLPGFPLEGGDPNACHSITLDAFLHWISPFITSPKVQQDFAMMFADALKYHVFPQDTFFEMSDFLVFDDMDWDTRELPASDIEECVQFLRKTAPSLNPGNPADRERLHAAVSKFFADPGRKYKMNVTRLESEAAESKKAVEEERRRRELELQDRDEKIVDLQKQIENERKAREKERLRNSAYRRLGVVVAICIALLAFVGFSANKWGDGDNVFQKLLGAWPYFTGAIAVSGGLFYLILGKDRVRALGWGIRKALGDE